MKTCLSDGQYDHKRVRDKELCTHLETPIQNYVHIHFGLDRPGNPLLTAVTLVQRFAASVNNDRFDIELGELLGSPMPATATGLIKGLADVFCDSAHGIEAELLKKSLQEALLLSIDVQGDATVDQFRDLLREYLECNETVGLIRLFAGLHMFNTIWLELQESDAISIDSEEALDKLTADLEETCLVQAGAAITSGLIGNLDELPTD